MAKERTYAQQILAESRERELAVLVGGTWGGAWYWRNNLEAIQANTGHVAADLASYQPTDQWIDHPEFEDVKGWIWVPGEPDTATTQRAQHDHQS